MQELHLARVPAASRRQFGRNLVALPREVPCPKQACTDCFFSWDEVETLFQIRKERQPFVSSEQCASFWMRRPACLAVFHCSGSFGDTGCGRGISQVSGSGTTIRGTGRPI